MTDERHIIIFRTEAEGADETIFLGTLEDAREYCKRMVAEGECDSAYLEQDQ
jgi:hypothetical protein